MVKANVVIIGGGIAGASLAYRLCDRSRTVILEAENQPGYHTTGRSAALFTASYGHWLIRALTLASRDFLLEPPAQFSGAPLMQHRPVLWVAREDQKERLAAFLRDVNTLDATVRQCPVSRALELCPALEPSVLASAVLEPNAHDIDVHALHRGYLNAFRKAGGRLVTNARVLSIRRAAGRWEVKTETERYDCDIVVNAAGAWADEIAKLAGVAPIGLVPRRRTAITFDVSGMDPREWPCVLDIDEEFYFKPEAGRVLASPADETPSRPIDAQPEEIDIAAVVDRIERATKLRVSRIAAKWAGLRCFVDDRLPVVGMDPGARGFFWLAGQGGAGIMTSPALGEMAAALIDRTALPASLVGFGIRPEHLSRDRLAITTAVTS